MSRNGKATDERKILIANLHRYLDFDHRDDANRSQNVGQTELPGIHKVPTSNSTTVNMGETIPMAAALPVTENGSSRISISNPIWTVGLNREINGVRQNENVRSATWIEMNRRVPFEDPLDRIAAQMMADNKREIKNILAKQLHLLLMLSLLIIFIAFMYYIFHQPSN